MKDCEKEDLAGRRREQQLTPLHYSSLHSEGNSFLDKLVSLVHGRMARGGLAKASPGPAPPYGHYRGGPPTGQAS
jgi:hypothetical protein